MSGVAKRIGRPTKAPRSGERVPLGLRVTAAVKRRLDKAAEASGRSQSQEAEIRLEQSFTEVGDPDLRSMASAWTWTFVQGADLGRYGHPEEKDRRRTDPTTWTYQMGAVALVRSLMVGVPVEQRLYLLDAIKTGISNDALDEMTKAKRKSQ